MAGLYSGSTSICRYTVTGTQPKKDVSELLASFKFRSIDDTSDELSSGWVPLDDPDSNDFSTVQRGDYFGFSYRADQRKISGSVLKKLCKKEEKKFLAKKPEFKKVPRQDKLEIKDRCRIQILAKTLPSTSLVDVIWNHKTGEIWVLTSATRYMVEVEELFHRTFDNLRMTFLTPYAIALESDYRDKVENANAAGSDAILDIIQSNRWIGTSLLESVLKSTSKGNTSYEDKDDEWDACINGKVVMATPENETKIAITGDQGDFSEALLAMEEGKNIVEAGIKIETDEGVWNMSLKADTLILTGLKTPKTVPDEDEVYSGLFFEKIALIENGLEKIDAMLHKSIKEVLS